MSNRVELPEKLFFKIGEVARIADVKQHVLRYWESEFPSIRPQKSKSNQRLYRRRDVEAVLAIKHLLYDLKFTIEGAKKHMREQGVDASLPPPDPAIIAAKARDEARAEADQSLKRKEAQLSAHMQRVLLGLRKEVSDFLLELNG